MSLGFESLLRARLLAARDEPRDNEASRALEHFRTVPAPWYEAKALRMLGRVDKAAPIEHRLRLAGPAG